MAKVRISRRVKKWKRKMQGGQPTLPDRIPFKPSWFIMPWPVRHRRFSRVTKRWIYKIRKSDKQPLKKYF